MPTYLYSCGTHEFEEFQSINDPPLERCPECEKVGEVRKPVRLIGSTSFVLSGGGWASSGYSSK